MTDALRRILWLFPVLAAGALLIFLVLGSTRSIKAELTRPLFYNPAPQSAQVAAKAALDQIVAGKPEGVQSLRVLGGAALPVVLDALSAMNVNDQRLVSAALTPLTQRMKLSGKATWDPPPNGAMVSRPQDAHSDHQLLFWERYRDEHALDLRPLATSRLVRRMAQRNAAHQNADLLAVDTFALPTLISTLGRIKTEDDVARCRRLVATISHVTERDWSIPAGASTIEAEKTVTEIRRFWDREGSKWTQLDGLELLVARFSQTEFATWVFRSSRQVTRLDHPDLFERLSMRGSVSVPLAAFCLLGLLVLGPAVAATIQVLALRQSRWQLERIGLRAGLAAGLMLLVSVLLATSGASWGRLSLICILMGTTFSTFMLHRELNDRLDWRTHHVLRNRPGLRRVSAVARWIAPSIPTLTPIAVAEAAVWVTCLEVGSEIEGQGIETLRALRGGDLDFLMAMCLGLGLATGTAQVFADMLLGSGRSTQGET